MSIVKCTTKLLPIQCIKSLVFNIVQIILIVNLANKFHNIIQYRKYRKYRNTKILQGYSTDTARILQTAIPQYRNCGTIPHLRYTAPHKIKYRTAHLFPIPYRIPYRTRIQYRCTPRTVLIFLKNVNLQLKNHRRPKK